MLRKLILGAAAVLVIALVASPGAEAVPSSIQMKWAFVPEPIVLLPPGRTYNNFARTLTVCKGDKVSFVWTGLHSLVTTPDVLKYGNCTTKGAKVLAKPAKSGTKTITYKNAPKTYYYMCGVANHCKRFMQMIVNVGPAC